MNEAPALSIVLPTYNEAENILPLIDAVQAALAGLEHEIIVVDDDSPDGTWRLVAGRATQDGRVRLLHRTRERGLTSALNAGLAAARGRVAGWMDCDLSHPPALLPALLRALESGADAAIASRYAPGGADARGGRYSLQRRLSLLLSGLSLVATGLPVRDITSGYLLLRREALQAVLPLAGDYGEYFIDLCARLHRKGCRLEEIPYSFTNRERGESKTGSGLSSYARRGVKYLRMLVRHRRRLFGRGGEDGPER